MAEVHRSRNGRTLWRMLATVCGRHPWLVVGLAALAAHAGALGAVFYLDDGGVVESLADPEPYLRWGPTNFRLATKLTFWLGYQVAGLSPVVFHAVNVLLHAGTAVLVYTVGCDWLRRFAPRLGSVSPAGLALAAALLFAVHPLGSEITHYVRARDTLLMTAFGLASAWCLSCYTGRRVSCLVAAAGLGLLAAYSKPTGLPWLAGLWLWTGLCFWPSATWRALFGQRVLWLSVSGLLMLGLALPGVPLAHVLLGWWDRAARLGLPSLEITWLTQLRLTGLLCRLLLWPSDLVSDHQPFDSTRWTDPGVLAALAGLGLVAVFGVWAWRRWRLPVWALGTLFGSHLMHGFYTTGEGYAEYRAYPSLAAFSLLAAWSLAAVLARRRWFVVVWAVLLLAALPRTLARSPDWWSLERLNRDVLTTYPLHVRAHQSIMWSAFEQGDHAAVRGRLEQLRGAMHGLTAFNRDNRWGRLYKWDQAVLFAIYGESLAARSLARTAGMDAGLLAMARLRRNIDQQPRHYDIYEDAYAFGLGMIYADAGQYDRAWQTFSPRMPFRVRTLRREVRKVATQARAAGQPFSWLREGQ